MLWFFFNWHILQLQLKGVRWVPLTTWNQQKKHKTSFSAQIKRIMLALTWHYYLGGVVVNQPLFIPKQLLCNHCSLSHAKLAILKESLTETNSSVAFLCRKVHTLHIITDYLLWKQIKECQLIVWLWTSHCLVCAARTGYIACKTWYNVDTVTNMVAAQSSQITLGPIWEPVGQWGGGSNTKVCRK